jgi:hypothetical protein
MGGCAALAMDLIQGDVVSKTMAKCRSTIMCDELFGSWIALARLRIKALKF